MWICEYTKDGMSYGRGNNISFLCPPKHNVFRKCPNNKVKAKVVRYFLKAMTKSFLMDYLFRGDEVKEEIITYTSSVVPDIFFNSQIK